MACEDRQPNKTSMCDSGIGVQHRINIYGKIIQISTNANQQRERTHTHTPIPPIFSSHCSNAENFYVFIKEFRSFFVGGFFFLHIFPFFSNVRVSCSVRWEIGVSYSLCP